MKTAIVLLSVILGASAVLRFDEADAKNRPVTKVVTLLKDMSAQLEKEGEEDEEVYDKMVCWCETNDKEKTKAIADAEQWITDLGAQIEELTGLSARLSAEITTLNSEVAENSDALDKATAMREKELAEFTANEADSLASITSLGSAVDTLSKHNSLVQTSEEMRAALSHTVKKHSAMVGNMLMPSERRTLNAFVQAPEDFLSGGSFAQQSGPQNAGSYAPQSGAIFGVLKNMKESFEANLAQSQRDESDSEKAYRELKAAKESEIAAGTKQIETKTIQMSNADQKKAEAKQDLEDTTNTMNADSEFLGKLKEHCALAD
jgi:chromosome segregation ATPase